MASEPREHVTQNEELKKEYIHLRKERIAMLLRNCQQMAERINEFANKRQLPIRIPCILDDAGMKAMKDIGFTLETSRSNEFTWQLWDEDRGLNCTVHLGDSNHIQHITPYLDLMYMGGTFFVLDLARHVELSAEEALGGATRCCVKVIVYKIDLFSIYFTIR